MAPMNEVAGSTGLQESSGSRPKHARLVVPALAALVMRQARTSLIEGRMIAGVDKRYASPIGLSAEDRRAMALVSRACLASGNRDYGGEIHDLLAMCTLPLGQWLLVKEVTDAGLAETRLISQDNGAPTSEAAELAAGFSTVAAGVEELLFATFREALEKQPKAAAYEYYASIREFVVRHSLASSDQIKGFGMELPSKLWMLLQQHFYEPVPFGWSNEGKVSICSSCGNAMRKSPGGLVCRTAACAASRAATVGGTRPIDELLRVTRGIQQYWVEPGLDELRLYDALVRKGVAADLYPLMDRVDIAVGDIGIDLKAYASPELLGEKIRRNKGGLAFYEKKWLVIPDWRVDGTPQYLDRLRHALEEASKVIRSLSLTEALRELADA